jgi:hypothetical protein
MISFLHRINKLSIELIQNLFILRLYISFILLNNFISVYLTHQKYIFLFREDDTADQDNLHSDGFSPEAVDSSNTFGDDMLQMALKMATEELDEPAVDLEAALTPNTITATQAPPQPENSLDNDGK